MEQSSNQLIPDPQLPSHSQIPESVSVSESTIDYDNEKVLFSFRSYEENKCEIADLDKRGAKQLTKRLKDINSVLKKHLKQRQQTGFECKGVINAGKYTPLFTNLPQDVDELLEIDYSETGRIFGYMTKNILNITVIKKRHT